MIQDAPWDAVAARVDELGLTPPPVAAHVIDDALIADIQTLPDGDVLASGLLVYAENCVACHGANGEGTTLAPALNTDDLRSRLTDADITRIVAQGVPGTLMAGWERALDVRRNRGRHRCCGAGPNSTPLGCAAHRGGCGYRHESRGNRQRRQALQHPVHAVSRRRGYGTPLAPALNNQTFLSQTPDAAIQQIIAGGVLRHVDAGVGRLSGRGGHRRDHGVPAQPGGKRAGDGCAVTFKLGASAKHSGNAGNKSDYRVPNTLAPNLNQSQVICLLNRRSIMLY
jgi:hypothetical protein